MRSNGRTSTDTARRGGVSVRPSAPVGALARELAFDAYGTDAVVAEWDQRDADRAWADYADALAELADSGLRDVVAHCVLVKGSGHIPDVGRRHAIEDQMVETLAASGPDVEVSPAGWQSRSTRSTPPHAC